MFISSSMDGVVQIWDTNRFAPAASVDLGPGQRCYRAALHPGARRHALVALGTAARAVRLGDLTGGGGWTHELTGHGDAVAALAWSPSDEFLLASGSNDCTVRLWDVRRSGASACLASLCAANDGPLADAAPPPPSWAAAASPGGGGGGG
eukprot:CAMPEP_0194590208 /NCGR_PEP_ID=MMETSP0292-20121207/21167_1 /TAXON_ID=39354 /ORGANISM="Heterosigma akashiwo, Strain CCMP2393" /LENGTH=149 /DNA_ID=CAMNT_0039447715 /DNA_START=508 /DNA_END=953 /DNA_ORIENTATION=+